MQQRTPKWDDSELVQISALEHWAYCPRQCGLIHLEQTFDENIYTLKGRLLHERTDEPTTEWQEGIRIERALPLWSDRLGLVGKADTVEFHERVPFPIEYKHGPRRRQKAADLQLCAQVLCLEEMTGAPVPRGAIFHQGSRRRREVIFGEVLRSEVARAVKEVREMLALRRLPEPVNDSRCRDCSLQHSCLPSVVGDALRLRKLRTELFKVEERIR